MTVRIITGTSMDEVDRELHSVHGEDWAPTLALVFCGVPHDPAALIDRFARQGIEVFGACTDGEFTHQEVGEGTIVAMLMDFRREAFRIKLFDGGEEEAAAMGRSVADWAGEEFESPACMVLTAGLQSRGERFVHAFINRSSHGIPLFGGIAGNEKGGGSSVVFNNARIAEEGAVALALDSRRVALHGVAASGWKGVGTPKTITRAKGNVVYTIDGAPALDMYNRYLNIGDDPSLAYEYPLLLMREDGSYILRGSINVNADNSITYGGPIPEGIQVRFSMAPGLEIIDHAVAKVSEMRATAPDADAVVLFSCQGRKFTLGPSVADEIEAIHGLWNAPLIGFFTNGEIGPTPGGRCELHNHTLVPVVIRQIK